MLRSNYLLWRQAEAVLHMALDGACEEEHHHETGRCERAAMYDALKLLNDLDANQEVLPGQSDYDTGYQDGLNDRHTA